MIGQLDHLALRAAVLEVAHHEHQADRGRSPNWRNRFTRASQTRLLASILSKVVSATGFREGCLKHWH